MHTQIKFTKTVLTHVHFRFHLFRYDTNFQSRFLYKTGDSINQYNVLQKEMS